MTEENTKQPDPAETGSPKGVEQPMYLPFKNDSSMNGDRLDEVVNYLAACRSPNIFDTRAPFIVVPEGLKVLDVEQHMPVPSRVRKKLIFTETDSFLDYYNLFKDSYKPRMFSKMSQEGISFLCVFDYDGPGVKNDKGISGTHPQWNTHRAYLHLAFHRDYAVLRAKSDQWFEQEEFALFIEENRHLFVSPDSATMMEIAQELKGTRNVGWKSGKRISNGRVSLEWVEEIEAKSTRGDVEVPETLKLASPIFEGFESQELEAAFRYRLDGDGGIKFSYRLLTKLAEREAQEEVRKKIHDDTQLKIYAVSTFDGIFDQA